MHKLFEAFPFLLPVVSCYNSCTARLSEFIHSFLQYQAKLCNSYIRDTKDFLNKLKQISNLPKNTYLVTMDAESVYTNIDGEEGAETCRIKSENHENKNVQINFNCVDT